MTCVKNIYIISNIAYNIPLKYKENFYEEDLSAQEKTEKQGSRLQKKNGFHRGKKGFEEKKRQGQKEAFGIKGEISENKEKRRFSEAVQEGKKDIFPLYNVNLFSFGQALHGRCRVQKARQGS